MSYQMIFCVFLVIFGLAMATTSAPVPVAHGLAGHFSMQVLESPTDGVFDLACRSLLESSMECSIQFE
ncbi:unnamed protein product [Caenorhabditis angaria]|uniref:Uncharacterized protein n=1 Tax=Caenorhabditis angaria TaxID=860376 RepID=A0A9P1ILJ5_9PELO|nr:unnamed protein product [Caenorhabditis angaria]